MIPRLRNIIVLLFFTIVLIAGCSITGSRPQDYYSAAKEFNNIYFQVVEQIDVKNTMKSLEALQLEENRASIEKLGNLLDIIKQTIPKDREPLYYDFKRRYEDLVFLGDSYARFDKLSIEEKRKINSAIIMIGYNKADRKNKNSTTVWE